MLVSPVDSRPMELSLRDYLRILRKRVWLVALVTLMALGAAIGVTALVTPSFRAEAKLFVGQRQVATTEVQQGVQITQLSFQLLKTYAEVIRTRPIAERAVEGEGLDLSPLDVIERLRADPILDTQLIRLSFDDPDPVRAQRVVNSVAAVFAEEVQRIEHRPEGAGEAAVQVEVVEPALRPDEPVRPRPIRNLSLALALGLMLGLGVALLAEYLDVTIKDREDIERVTALPALAEVPAMAGGEASLNRDPQSQASEAYRKLRTALQFLSVDHPLQVVMVTSPFAAEGKTTTAVNVASAFAQAGLRSLLVEGDLRRPSFQAVFGQQGGLQRGLTTVLIGRSTLDAAISPTSIPNLSVLPAGALPPNPSELLASDHMVDLLADLRRRHEIIVIDAPPLLPVADASALAPRVDGVILVARAGKTKRDRLLEAVELTQKVGGRLLGTVLNGTKGGGDQYGYYYYGYRSKSEAPPDATFEVRDASPPAPQQQLPEIRGGQTEEPL